MPSASNTSQPRYSLKPLERPRLDSWDMLRCWPLKSIFMCHVCATALLSSNEAYSSGMRHSHPFPLWCLELSCSGFLCSPGYRQSWTRSGPCLLLEMLHRLECPWMICNICRDSAVGEVSWSFQVSHLYTANGSTTTPHFLKVRCPRSSACCSSYPDMRWNVSRASASSLHVQFISL